MPAESERVEPAIPLLRCPFDGAHGVLYLEIDREFAKPDEIGVVSAQVHCHDCCARGPHCDTYAFDEDDIQKVNREAAEAWNKAPRPEPSTVNGEPR